MQVSSLKVRDKMYVHNFFSLQTGTIVLIALAFLMPLMAYIPKTILSAVIITSVIFLVELEEIKPMWKTNSM